MQKSTVERLIVAVVVLAFSVRGLMAIAEQQFHLSSKTGTPTVFTGTGAILFGVSHLALALLVFSAWLAVQPQRRRQGLALAGFALLVSCGTAAWALIYGERG